MDNWGEIRTAYTVAKIGAVSGAAGVTGVHHATVIRHIDALEERLGVPQTVAGYGAHCFVGNDNPKSRALQPVAA